MTEIPTGADGKLETVDFRGLVFGFASAALYYLGENPIEGKSAPEKNLPLAKQNIDILEMLKEKTLGNLQPDEDQLLQQLLGDLMSRYVAAKK